MLWNTRKPNSIPKSVCGCLLATLSDFTKDDFITFLEASGHYPTWGMKYTDSGMCGDKGYNYGASFRFLLEDGDSVSFQLYDRFGVWRVGGTDERIVPIMQELGFTYNSIETSHCENEDILWSV